MPAAENPTVAMVEAAYRHHGLDARYLNCEVAPEALGDAVRGARAMGWAGFNCSIPHKVAVIEHLDGLGESAAVIGAVNCVVERDGRWIGENTDGQGFMEALRTVVDPAGRSLVILGAGGAARAIAVEAALAGAASITVVNRGRERGEELAALLADAAGRRTPRARQGGSTFAAVAMRRRSSSGARPRAPTSSSTRPRSASSPTSTRASPLDARVAAAGHGRRRRDPQPAAHAPDPRRRGARLHGARRARDARQPGRDRRSATGPASTPTRRSCARALEDALSLT